MEKKQAEIKEFEKVHAPTKVKATINTASKTLFGDALRKMTEESVITPYTRDKLLGLLESGVKKDYGRFKKHFHDLLDLHETIVEDQ